MRTFNENTREEYKEEKKRADVPFHASLQGASDVTERRDAIKIRLILCDTMKHYLTNTNCGFTTDEFHVVAFLQRQLHRQVVDSSSCHTSAIGSAPDRTLQLFSNRSNHQNHRPHTAGH